MTDNEIKSIALACCFKLKDQGAGAMDLNPYVYDFARAIIEADRAARTASAAPEVEYVPIAVHQSDFAQGRHPKDDTAQNPACQKALDKRGDDRGQGLDPYWKWGFRTGFAAALATPPAHETGARDAERYQFLRKQPYETWKAIAFNTWCTIDEFIAGERDKQVDAAIRALRYQPTQKGGE